MLSALLTIELEVSTPRQRTILRRELLRKNWRLVPHDEMLFAKPLSGFNSDEKALDFVTRQLKSALRTAMISRWGADCMFATDPAEPSTPRAP